MQDRLRLIGKVDSRDGCTQKDAKAIPVCLEHRRRTLVSQSIILLCGTCACMRFDMYGHVCAEDDPREWPGPKAWPATLSLISFFAVNVFGQALLRA